MDVLYKCVKSVVLEKIITLTSCTCEGFWNAWLKSHSYTQKAHSTLTNTFQPHIRVKMDLSRITGSTTRVIKTLMIVNLRVQQRHGRRACDNRATSTSSFHKAQIKATLLCLWEHQVHMRDHVRICARVHDCTAGHNILNSAVSFMSGFWWENTQISACFELIQWSFVCFQSLKMHLIKMMSGHELLEGEALYLPHLS